MGQTWKGYIQVNGDGVSIYKAIDIPVTDEMYEKIQETVNSGIPLSNCSFYRELSDAAEAEFDLAECIGFESEKPDPDDFEDEEEYEEALEEYKEEAEGLWDSYFLESVDIDDPGDFERFRAHFIGRQYETLSDGSGGELEVELQEYGDRIVDYYLTVCYDEDGKITDISDLQSSGLESENIKTSNYGDCYPNFDLLSDLLEEKLEGED